MDILARTLSYLGATLLIGAGVFALWIGPEMARSAARGQIRLGSLAGVCLLLVGTVLGVIRGLLQALGEVDLAMLPAYLSETRHGNAAAARIALAVLLGVMAPGRGGRISGPLFLALAAGLLASFSLTSHAAGLGGVLPTLADLAHLSGAAVWAGVVLYLAWAPVWLPSLPQGVPGDSLSQAVRQTSAIGLACVVLLVATGAYVAALHLWGPVALSATPYGRTLMGKLAAIGLLLAIAAVNRWVLAPGLGRPGFLRAIGRLLKVESLVLVTVLSLTALLTTRPLPEPPAFVVGVVIINQQAGPWLVRGSLAPGIPDGLTLEMSVQRAGGGPPVDPRTVEAVMTMQGHPMPPVVIRPTATGPGSFRASISLPMAGSWDLAIVLPGAVLRVPVTTRSGPRGASAWAPVLPGLLLAAAAAVVAGAVLDRTGLRTRKGRLAATTGGALLVVGLTLAVRAAGLASSPGGIPDRQNPIAPTVESLAVGGRLYRQHCQACHGPAGAGDGPAAAALRPPPADLRVHMAAGHTDGQLFHWISEGMPGTAMPAFKDVISEEDRWHVLNFIKTFALSDR
ncbi:MAG: CopD family protein [Armatimonadota bacterium]|nr:CopD family protein [Armatimonadota bacterium]MDR7519370.1 CopD family protein [Armatimonadota bacterium]MDR7549507.1 CopD family protein [Armatimonadota bacterium]